MFRDYRKYFTYTWDYEKSKMRKISPKGDNLKKITET